jgi:mono/diheme cytochrome c family protein
MSHDSHQPDAPERTNPVIWTIGLLVSISVLAFWFATNWSHGTTIGREHGMLPPSESAGPAEPNHAELIADRSEDVIDQGAVLFAKNCASCHGPQGNSNVANMNPAPRNFWQDAFNNPNGGGPYGLYTVLSKGFNGMPAFPSLKPEERYAVIHFVQERFVKPNNPDNYHEVDSPEVTAKIPAAGGEGSGPTVKPNLREVPEQSRPLMAAVAESATPVAAANEAWIARACDGAEGRAGRILKSLAHQRVDGYLAALAAAVSSDDRERVQVQLATPALGVALPEGALLTAAEFDHLYAQLRKAKPSASAGVQ